LPVGDDERLVGCSGVASSATFHPVQFSFDSFLSVQLLSSLPFRFFLVYMACTRGMHLHLGTAINTKHNGGGGY
jgi:hypothetical protein